MLLRSVLIVISVLPALISGNQFPIVNQVIGDVPHPDGCNFGTPKGASANNAPAPTPGKLRVVENSGVCGAVIFFTTHLPGPVILTVLAETTKGVYQASGYGDLASDKSIWLVLHLGRLFVSFLSVFHRQVLVLCRTQKP
jgi:hypothetical protein